MATTKNTMSLEHIEIGLQSPVAHDEDEQLTPIASHEGVGLTR